MVKCTDCEFESTSKLGLKVHRSRVHLNTVTDRFWDKVNKKGKFDCWEWEGATGRLGYGQFKYKGENKRSHRFIFSYFFDINLEEKHILHNCDNPPCVNPQHLYIGNHEINMRDKSIRNRMSDRRGENNNFSELSEEDVEEIYKKRHIDNKPLKEISDEFNTSVGNVSDIINDKTWTHVTSDIDKQGGMSKCYCHRCDNYYHHLGIKNHKNMHKNRNESVRITYSDGSTKIHKFSTKKESCEI